MKTGALVLGVLGGLGALSIGVLTYLFGSVIGLAPANANAAALIKLLSVAVPVAALFGAGMVAAKPMVGGVIMLGCAAILFFTLGFGFFTFSTEILIGIAGVLGVLSANSAQPAPSPAAGDPVG